MAARIDKLDSIRHRGHGGGVWALLGQPAAAAAGVVALAVALVPAVTVALAEVLHRFVELPAIALGRRLSREPAVAARIDDPFAPRVR